MGGTGTRTGHEDPAPRVVRRRGTAPPPAGRGGAGSRSATSKSKAKSKAASGTGAARSAKPSSGPSRAAKRSGGNGAAAPARGPARYLVRPEITGPRVRVGILWFLIATAAATAGRWWTAGLWALLAAAAGRELVQAWAAGPEGQRPGLPRGAGWLAAAAAAAVPLAAGYGTGAAGLALLAAALLTAAVAVLGGGPGSVALALPVAAVLPALAAGSVVLAVRIDLWAGLFLILVVSLYDAGSFVMGSEARSAWEGPVGGVVGAVAGTFTMAAFGARPFDARSAWITGGAMVVACPLGVALVSAALPSPDAHARALRRLDAYLVAGPVLVAGAWLLT